MTGRFSLEPCPFCEGRAVPVMRNGMKGGCAATRSRYFRGYIKCTGCGATSAAQKSPEAMARVWNRRPIER